MSGRVCFLFCGSLAERRLILRLRHVWDLIWNGTSVRARRFAAFVAFRVLKDAERKMRRAENLFRLPVVMASVENFASSGHADSLLHL